MLVAEILASKAGKTLDFGRDVWEGDEWAAAMRKLIAARDVDSEPAEDEEQQEETTEDAHIDEKQRKGAPGPAPAETGKSKKINTITVHDTTGYDSDDSLTGYASPPSSRAPSPSPSELAELERDPTLAVGVKKVSRPVYLLQLAELVRPTGANLKEPDPREAADKIEMALQVGEELVRRKAAYGTELGRCSLIILLHGP
jgi:telomere length regulation protein